MTDPGLWVIYGYLALVATTWTYVRIRSWLHDRHQPDRDDGGFDDPDQTPGPRDDTYHQLETAYRLPAARRTP